jgi:hypothetical protein
MKEPKIPEDYVDKALRELQAMKEARKITQQAQAVPEPEKAPVKHPFKLSMWKQPKNQFTAYPITMFYGNGTMEHFVVESGSRFFTHSKDKKYHLDTNKVIWDVFSHENRLFYHENSVEPIEFKTIQTSEGDQTFAAVTPQNLAAIIRMEFVRIFTENELDRLIRYCLYVGLACLGILIIMVIVMVAQSGLFQQMSQAVQGVAVPK